MKEPLSLKLTEVKSIIFSHIAFLNEAFSALLVIPRKMETVTIIASHSLWLETVVVHFRHCLNIIMDLKKATKTQ
jgi:hypothetical protein